MSADGAGGTTADCKRQIMYPVRVRANPHTTGPNASTPTKSNHPTRHRVSQSSHNAPRTLPTHRFPPSQAHRASPSSHNDPQRRTTDRFQPSEPSSCEPILTQRRRHSSHWHHCTVADGRPAHVKSYESRGTYPTTHTTCGTSPQKAQARRHLASCVRHDIRNSPDTNRQ